MSKPYKEVNPGDPILAVDWNTIQSDIRQHILTHTHTGSGESGAQLDITALTSGADLAVRKLSVSDSLTVGAANQPLFTVNPAAPNQEGNYQVNVAGTLRAEQVRTSRLDGITSLAVGALAVTGNVGIGVADAPTARLEVNGDGKFSGPVFTPQLMGDPARETLEIMGAGSAETARKITLWAEGGATVQGGLTVRGGIRFGDGAGAGQWLAGSTYVGLRDNGNTDRLTILQSNGNVGINTLSPDSRLTINGNITHDNNYNAYGDAPLTIFEPTANGGSTPAATRDILNLVREGVTAQAYGNKVSFALGRYEHNSTNSRTQLDIKLTEASFNSHPVVMSLRSNGNVGIGTTEPASRLQIDKGRVDITASDVTTGGQNRFNGLPAWNEQTTYRRGQLVLSSSYSDLVIASSHANDNHGSTLTLATYNPSDATDYRKWVINQGNWGARKQFLEFGYADTNGRANPHNNINATDTVLALDGINKRVGIGVNSPGARLSFRNTDSSELADGITWYNPTPTAYGIYRTAGAWSAPNYQQLRLNWLTGIVLDPGTGYAKSYVDIQGDGLRVTTGSVGIGTPSPGTYKLNVQGGNAFFSDHLEIGNFQAADRFLTFKVQGGNKYRSGVRFWAWQENFGYSIEYDERDSGLHFKNHNINVDGTPLMTIKNSNVGIGVVNPGVKLEVSGAGKFTGALTVAGNLAVPGGDETLRMLRGIVNSNGTIFAGSGFSVSRAGVGLFDITFATAFPSIPGATATQIFGRANSGTEIATHTGGSTLDNAVIAHLSANMMRVKTGGDTGAAADRVFSFIVIGPR